MTILGYKSKHYLNEHEYKEFCNRNSQSYQFLNDLPISIRYQELDKCFPNSKFIYTIREANSWLTSCEYHWKVTTTNRSNWPDYKKELFGIDVFDKSTFLTVYDNHQKSIINYFKNRLDDLLIIDIPGGDGWNKLCSFLNVSIKQSPFPNKNKQINYQ